MEWGSCLEQAIEYMEEHLLDVDSTEYMVKQIADDIQMSPYYFQKCFQLVTGFSVGEYLRNRRLYEAACELSSVDKKVIDVALKYGYDTPASFSKAFRRFHGVPPTTMREYPKLMKTFLPIQVKISVLGGNRLEYVCEKMPEFTVIGFQEIFSYPASYKSIPNFCRKIQEKYFVNLRKGLSPNNEYEQAVVDYGIGGYGAVLHDIGKGKFRYLMAGMYTGGTVPAGMVLHTFKTCDWVKFKCVGPNPDTFLQLHTQVFRDWVPEHKEFQVTGRYNIERFVYDKVSGKQESYIWIPAKKREKE